MIMSMSNSNTFAADAKTFCCELLLLMLIMDIITFPSWKTVNISIWYNEQMSIHLSVQKSISISLSASISIIEISVYQGNIDTMYEI